MIFDKQCAIDGCDRPAKARGWCLSHYNCWHRGNDPLTAGIRPYRPRPSPAEFAADIADPRHGTVNGYQNLSCRCAACREAWTTYVSARRKRGQDA